MAGTKVSLPIICQCSTSCLYPWNYKPFINLLFSLLVFKCLHWSRWFFFFFVSEHLSDEQRQKNQGQTLLKDTKEQDAQKLKQTWTNCSERRSLDFLPVPFRCTEALSFVGLLSCFWIVASPIRGNLYAEKYAIADPLNL